MEKTNDVQRHTCIPKSQNLLISWFHTQDLSQTGKLTPVPMTTLFQRIKITVKFKTDTFCKDIIKEYENDILA